MKLGRPHVWLALLSGVAVVSVAVVDARKTSPGPLTAVHGRESDLQGRGGCSECHGGWTSNMTESCLDCHDDVAAQLEDRHGLHGAVAPKEARRCAACHSEHHGEGFAMVNRQSFARAGSPDPEAFDHARIGFAMEGRHLELTCEECHPNALADVLPTGGKRFLGLDRDCAACHEDVHEGRFAIDCASCHAQVDFHVLGSTGHEEHLPLIGGHGGLDCRTCHAEDTEHSLEALGSRGAKPSERTCVDCHPSPHDEPFVAAVALQERRRPAMVCVACHVPEHEGFELAHDTTTAAWHAASGFPLDVPHDGAACEDCHSSVLPEFAMRYPGRSPQACSACHDDVHEGQFESGPFAGAECTACHAAEHWEPHAFGPQEHELTSLPLTGRHLETACNACHAAPAEGRPREFHGTSSRCEACHPDAHAGFFERQAVRGGDYAALVRDGCAVCHDAESFSGRRAAGFAHDLWTGFPVEGAHAQSSCESCHPRADEPDENGRTLGFVDRVFGTFDANETGSSGCVTCHRDPHRGEFDEGALPWRVEGRTDCARCHVATSFRAFPDGFDHRRWTGFALRDAHAEASCTACHAPLPSADELGRSWGRANGARCADCHEDPHAGQFRAGEATTCERCHRSAESFAQLVFHHDRDARFQLGEAHAEVACADCHPGVPFGDGVLVRYRPIKRECIDCHGAHEETLLRRRGKKR